MSFTTASNRACANDSASTIAAQPPRKLSHQNFVTTLPPTHTGDAQRCEGRARQKCGARAANRRNRRAGPECLGGVATPQLNSGEHGLFVMHYYLRNCFSHQYIVRRMELVQLLPEFHGTLVRDGRIAPGRGHSCLDDLCSIAVGTPRDGLRDGVRAPHVRPPCDHRRCAHQFLCGQAKSNDVPSLVNDASAMRGVTLMQRRPSNAGERRPRPQ